MKFPRLLLLSLFAGTFAGFSSVSDAQMILYSQDFTDSATAASQLSTHGDGVFVFGNSSLAIGTSQSRFNYVRTNTANSFIDSGAASVTYSTNYQLTPGAANIAGLVFRLDNTSANTNTTTAFSARELTINTGYIVTQFYDGGTTYLIVDRTVNGTSTNLLGAVNTYPVLANNGPNTMSVTLTNTATAVNLAISFNGTFLTTVSDSIANGAIVSGQGIGVETGNNGTPGSFTTSFTSLTATTVPEPSTYAMMALAGLGLVVFYRRKAMHASAL